MNVCPNPQCQQPVPGEALFCPACGNSLQTPSEETGVSLVGRVLNQKYRLISELAEGGMALVYKAEHIFLDDICAIKIIKKGLSSKDEMLKRFQREAKLTRQVSRRSPYIISIYDFGMEDELGFFYVMELLDGFPFTELLQNPRIPPDPVRTVRLTCQICEALSVVHEEDLVHRDIKPDNIFLHRDESREEEMVKLLDFGIARPTQTKATMLTNYGRVMGTPEYMSPEQCRGPTPQQYERGESHLDGRSDIYSLGVLLYQCLTGDVPFPMPVDGGPMAIHKVMAGHVMEEPVPPTEKRPDLNIPQSLSDATLKAMAKSPSDRFQTMLEFRDALLAVYPELNAEFKGAVAAETSDAHLSTLPLGEMDTPQAEIVNDMSDLVVDDTASTFGESNLPNLDQTAIDVQLTPELMEEAKKWAQQFGSPAEPVAPAPDMTSQNVAQQMPAESQHWEQQVGFEDEVVPHTFDSPSDFPMRNVELDKTMTTPFDPGVMEQVREHARKLNLPLPGEEAGHQGQGVSIQSQGREGMSARPMNQRISSAIKDDSSQKRSLMLKLLIIGVPLLFVGVVIIIHFYVKALW